MHDSGDILGFISPTAEVLDSSLGVGCEVYRMARVKSSSLSDYVIVGDLARVDESKLDAGVRIDRFNHLAGAEIGRRSYTGPNTVILCAKVGNFTSISWGVTIGAPDHDVSRVTTHSFLYNKWDNLRSGAEPVYNRFAEMCEVGSDVWIGASATILRGVSVGDGAVIGANSVVTKDVPNYAVVAGAPARIIRFRFEEDVRRSLIEACWWQWSDDKIRKHYRLLAAAADIRVAKQLRSLRDE